MSYVTVVVMDLGGVEGSNVGCLHILGCEKDKKKPGGSSGRGATGAFRHPSSAFITEFEGEEESTEAARSKILVFPWRWVGG